MKWVSRPTELGMVSTGPLFLGDGRENFVEMSEEKEPDEAHAKPQSRKERTQRNRSRYRQPPTLIYSLPRFRRLPACRSRSASVLLCAFAALRELLRSPRPVAGIARTAGEPSRDEPWDFEFRISSFLRISDLGAAAGCRVPLTPKILARHAGSDEPPFLDFEFRTLSFLRISDFVLRI